MNITKSAFILKDYNPMVTFAIDDTKICNRILGSHQIFSKPISTNLCLLCYLLRIDEISWGAIPLAMNTDLMKIILSSFDPVT